MTLQVPMLDWKDHRIHLDRIRDAAIAAVNPKEILRSCLTLDENCLYIFEDQHKLDPLGNIYLVGAGKAGVGMSLALIDVLGDRIKSGVIAVPDLPEGFFPRMEYIEGGHPVPTEGSILAGNRIQSILSDVKEEDTVIVLISGGGSALLELPEEGIELQDLNRINHLLLRSGATINEVNTIRRQLSRIKGGGLAKMAGSANVIALILSDVIGDPLFDIASGLTIRNPTTAEDALAILEKYDLVDQVPEAVVALLREQLESDRRDDVGDFSSVHHYIIGNIRIASEAAKTTAGEIGFRGILVSSQIQGEAADIGRRIAALIRNIRETKVEGSTPTCLVFGGETTVTIRGSGLGGRNQELALSAAIGLANLEKVALMTLATDGTDGPTPAAGAIITGGTISRAQKEGLGASSYLSNNDSYSFFSALGDTISTGPTGTNVNDLIIGLVY